MFKFVIFILGFIIGSLLVNVYILAMIQIYNQIIMETRILKRLFKNVEGWKLEY